MSLQEARQLDERALLLNEAPSQHDEAPCQDITYLPRPSAAAPQRDGIADPASAMTPNMSAAAARPEAATFEYFPFLELSAELRILIYEFCVVSDAPLLALSACRQPDSTSTEQPAISKINRQVREEVLPIFYKMNKFEYHVATGDTEPLLNHLAAIGSRNCRLITKVEFRALDGCPSGFGEASDLVHACLQVGSLRGLEVHWPDDSVTYGVVKHSMPRNKTVRRTRKDPGYHATIVRIKVTNPHSVLVMIALLQDGLSSDGQSTWNCMHQRVDGTYRFCQKPCAAPFIDGKSTLYSFAGMCTLRYKVAGHRRALVKVKVPSNLPR